MELCCTEAFDRAAHARSPSGTSGQKGARSARNVPTRLQPPARFQLQRRPAGERMSYYNSATCASNKSGSLVGPKRMVDLLCERMGHTLFLSDPSVDPPLLLAHVAWRSCHPLPMARVECQSRSKRQFKFFDVFIYDKVKIIMTRTRRKKNTYLQ